MHPIQLLERYWKFTSFRPLQEEIIEALLQDEDTFALLPTGGGKTLCFQIPALIKDGICIVISPLIALIQDQINELKRKGIKAIALNSGLSQKDLDTLLDNAIYGNYKFLYLSPERLMQPLVKQRIQQMKISLIAVDEAHCISQWGYDFRPAYLNIAELRKWHPSVNCIALTATAKPEIIEDIVANLDLVNTKIFKGSFRRDNLAFIVKNCEDKWYELCNSLDCSLSSSIIYVRTRKDCKQLKDKLQQAGYSVDFYHGGLTSAEKKNKLDNWMANRTAIMVATTAFGMGIDKSDVDRVIHYSLPESIESYYQEAGRAGSHGLPAKAVLLVKSQDDKRLKQQFLDSIPSVSDVKLIYKKLCSYFQIAYGEGDLKVFQINFKNFCNTYQLNSTIAYNSLLVLDRNSVINLSKQFNFKTKIQFIVSNDQLFNYLERNINLEMLIKVLLRTYGGIFDHVTKIDLGLIIKKTQIAEGKLIYLLEQLAKDNIISLELGKSDAEIEFLKAREDDRTINPLIKTIKAQHEKKVNQIDSIIAFATSKDTCKQIEILNYFGEKSNENCGICSVCLSNRKEDKSHFIQIKTKVKDCLKQDILNSRELSKKLKTEERIIIEIIKELLEDDKISITKSNNYKWKGQ